MTILPQALAKGTLATLAAGAMTVTAASPADAQDRYRDRDRNDGISAGEVIAGAVVLGGIAAVIAAASKDDDRYDRRRGRYDDRRYDGRRYDNLRSRGRGYSARDAVDQCVRVAERQAQRFTGANAEVYEIRDVDRERDGFEVKGRIAVRNDYRGRGHRTDYRRGYRNAGWDEGRFTCEVRYGRVVDLDYRGIRNL